MSENTRVRVFYLVSTEVPVDSVSTDNEAICAALTDLDLPHNATVVGYNVVNPKDETFYLDADFRSLLEQGALEPIFDIKENLQILKQLLDV